MNPSPSPAGGLEALLRSDEEAAHYYQSLPGYIQDTLRNSGARRSCSAVELPRSDSRLEGKAKEICGDSAIRLDFQRKV